MDNTQLRSVTIEFTDDQKQVLKNTIAKDATDAELDLFIQVCVSHKLDPLKKEIFHSKYEGAMISKVAETIVSERQGGISGLVTQEEIDITPPKQVENTPGDIPNPKPESEPQHPGPKDVTNQYQTETDDDGNTKPPGVIQTSEGGMFIEYMVGVHEVVRSTDTGEITCRTCHSSDCAHADKVKQFLGVE